MGGSDYTEPKSLEEMKDLTPVEQEKFTVEEFANFVRKQDSLGDVAYYLNAENIRKANQEPEPQEGE